MWACNNCGHTEINMPITWTDVWPDRVFVVDRDALIHLLLVQTAYASEIGKLLEKGAVEVADRFLLDGGCDGRYTKDCSECNAPTVVPVRTIPEQLADPNHPFNLERQQHAEFASKSEMGCARNGGTGE